MNQKAFLTLVGVIFALLAALHVLRVLYGWSAVIGGWSVPMWLSWVALIVAAGLAYQAFRLSR